MRYYRVGQEEPDPADAAGQAAYAEAFKSEWPPTKDNAEAVGGAAATAACHAAAGATYGATEAAAQLGWCSAVGEFIGGVFYDLADSFFGTSEATRLNLDRINRDTTAQFETYRAGYRLCALSQEHGARVDCGQLDEENLRHCLYQNVINGTQTLCSSLGASHEVHKMRISYHLPSGRGQVWDLQTDKQLTEYLRHLAAAESGRAAEIIARNPNSKKSIGLVVAIGIAGFIGLGILQKLVTRGKF
jgi:hypothetical protein